MGIPPLYTVPISSDLAEEFLPCNLSGLGFIYQLTLSHQSNNNYIALRHYFNLNLSLANPLFNNWVNTTFISSTYDYNFSSKIVNTSEKENLILLLDIVIKNNLKNINEFIRKENINYEKFEI